MAVSEVVKKKAKQAVPLTSSLEIVQWEDIVKEIVDKARSNAITPDMMKESGRRSWELLEELLPDPMSAAEGHNLEAELMSELERTVAALPANGDTTKKTLKGKEALLEIQRSLYRGTIPNWTTWAKLSKVSVAKKSENEVAALVELAEQVLRHPKFHNDIQQFIKIVFDCAAEAAELYAKYKRDLGLIDFTDQETLALQMLENKAVTRSLKERLDMVMVDEFQDTSPIQLALFLKLSKLVNRSVWVGDQKQSIYGFRGADPALMDAVIDSLGEPDTLPNSWRSQPALVDFASDFFASAFGAFGFPEKRVRLTSKVRSTTSKTAHLKCWRLDSRNQKDDALSLVSGIQAMLDAAAEYVILDKTTKEERTLKAGDIAVLCLTNDGCNDIAAALESRGVRAAIPRAGLMKRPEVVLVMSAYRYLLNRKDTLAVAELATIFNHEYWFELALEKGLDTVKQQLPMFSRLDEAREELASKTPSEILDVAIDASEAARMALGWDNPSLRQANLDALRGQALGFESICKARRCACTPFGLIRHFQQLEKNEEDEQAVDVSGETVQVLTYHKSKGLEWPVVILTGLNSAPRENPFGLSVHSPDQTFDLNDPLAGRWLRYWPWPFDFNQRMIVEGFSDVIAESDIALKEAELERQERLRLLYVGMTRARDYLIFAAREVQKKSTTAWLDSYKDNNDNQILFLPENEEQTVVQLGEKAFPIQVQAFSPAEDDITSHLEQSYAPIVSDNKVEHPPARFVPSSVTTNTSKVTVELYPLGPPLMSTADDPHVSIGNAVHAFLGIAASEQNEGVLREHAERIVNDLKLKDLDAEMLLEIHRRLQSFITKEIDKSGPCQIVTEWPIHMKRGLQKGSGWVDMICRTENGDIIVDHKTSMGSPKALEKKAFEYAGQLATYSDALTQASGRPVKGLWLHFALAGIAARVSL